ncbi:MAG TPA: RimK/LysX family protein [Candidatus Saccharimonadales bacterium]
MSISWSPFKRRKPAPVLVGRIVHVGLPELGIEDVNAKVDTGAFSGALHATDIQERTKADGTTVLRFKAANCRKTTQLSTYTIRRVKSSNGVVSQRYGIDTVVRIKGRDYPLHITLTDRSDIKYQVLIGRKFLRSHGFLVDVSKSKT